MQSKPSKQPKDEPEIAQEEAIPSDGKDVEGEEIMKEVHNDKLDPASKPVEKT